MVTRRFKLSAVGEQRVATVQGQLGPWDCAPVSIFLPESDAGPFFDWIYKSVITGGAVPEKAGVLEWMDLALTTVLVSVQLGGLGIVRYAPEPTKANVETLALVQIDMYCETMNLKL